MPGRFLRRRSIRASGFVGVAVVFVAHLSFAPIGAASVRSTAPTTVQTLASGTASTAVSTVASAAAPYPSVAFVVTCEFSHGANDDPIVHHGHTGASHRHDFFGNRSTNAESDAASLSRGSTTCNESADRAAYWLPTLKGAGWGTRMRSYYTAGAVAPSSIVAYPMGIQLIAGSPDSRESPGVDVVAFSCGRPVDGPGWTEQPTACEGPTTVRLTFPQCWDDKQLGAPGNAVAPRGGRCPATHPVALPLLRIVLSSKARVAPIAFATSAGVANRLHADFFNAWDPAVLDRLVSVCTRGERASNRDVKQCRAAGSGPRAAGGPNKTETNF